MRNSLKITLLLAVALLLTGCMQIQPPKVIPSEKSETIALKANFTDEISKESVILSDVKRAIVKMALEASKYEKLTSYSEDPECNWYQGVDVQFVASNLEVFYFRGRACRANRNDIKSGTTVYFGAKIPYKITGTQDKFEISFTYPKEFIQRDLKEFGLNEVTHLAAPSNLARDIDGIFQSLRNLSIAREYTFSGEENSKYNKDSTIDSLKRASLNNKNRTITYDVFNYQNGSKVTYKATVNYVIDHNNEVDVGKNVVSKIKQEIKKVINE